MTFRFLRGALFSLFVQGTDLQYLTNNWELENISLDLFLAMFTACKWVKIVGWNKRDANEKSVFSVYFQSNEITFE